MEKFNNRFTCECAELYYYDLICDEGRCSVPQAAVKHVNSCKNCQRKIEQLKTQLNNADNSVGLEESKKRNKVNDILKRHFAYIDKPVNCNDVKAFLPSLLDSDLKIKIPTPVTVHLNSCRQCQRDLQALADLNLNKGQLGLLGSAMTGCADLEALTLGLKDQQMSQGKIAEVVDVVSGIIEQDESGIETICRVDKSARRAVNEDFNIYAGFPIKVEKINKNAPKDEQKEGATISFKANMEPTSTTAPLARLLKPAIVAAAMIVIAAGVFLNMPTASAISIGQIYRAMEKVKNIYIANIAAGHTEAKQEFWVSRERNIYITKASQMIVFYDLNNGLKKEKMLNSNTIEESLVAERAVSGIKLGMYGFFGIMPFANMSDIPVDAQWNRITDETLNNDDGVEICELLWQDQGFKGSKGYWKYKFYVDAETDLPFKIEVYRKSNVEEEYVLSNLRIVKYLDSNEFEAAVIGNGF